VEDVKKICDDVKSVYSSSLADEVKVFLETFMKDCKRIDIVFVSYPWVIRVDMYAGDGNMIATRFFDLGETADRAILNAVSAVRPMINDFTVATVASAMLLELSNLVLDMKTRLLNLIQHYLTGKGFKCYEVPDDKYHIMCVREQPETTRVEKTSQ
jgi:hypothetical protein